MTHISFFFTLLMLLSILAGLAFGQEYITDTNTVALWQFNELHSDTVNDASGNGNLGTSIGTTIADGKFLKARSFNGISDRVTVPNSAELNVSPFLTLEAWIKPTAFSSGPNTFLRKNGPNSQNGYLMHFKNNGTVFDFGINTKFGLGTETSVDPSYFLDGRWHHVAGMYDGSIARVYFDGVLVDQDAFNETIGTNSTDPVSIGANDIYGEYFQGLIDEVRISNKVRQPSEFNLLLPPKNFTITAVGNTAMLSWENGGGAIALLHYNIYRGNDSTNVVLIDSSSLEAYADSELSADYRYYYRITGVDISGNEGQKSYSVSVIIPAINLLGEYKPDTNTVTLWHLNELHGDTVNDASGNGNNGRSIGTAIVNGFFGKARRFSNDADAININRENFKLLKFTVEARINIDSMAASLSHFIVSNLHSGVDKGFFLTINTANQKVLFTVGNGVGGDYHLFSSTSITEKRWYHIAATYDGSTMKIFINGREDASASWTLIAYEPDNTFPLKIGIHNLNPWDPAHQGFIGIIDEVRVSDKAREAYEFNLQLPPKNLTAIGSGRAINLAWQNGGGAVGLLTYKIYRGADSVNVALIDSTTLTSYSDSSVTSGTTYFYRVAALDSTGFEGAKSLATSGLIIFVGVGENQNLPQEYTLEQNFPNPFNPSTAISFALPSKAYVILKVFDVIGREVATLVSEELSAGNHSQQWSAEGLQTGIYFYRLQAGTFTETKKLVLLR